MERKMPPLIPCITSREDELPHSFDIARFSAVSADSNSVAPGQNEAGGICVLPVCEPIAELSSGEELSSQGTIDEIQGELRESSTSPEYPLPNIQHDLWDPDCHHPKPVDLQVDPSEEKKVCRKRRAEDNEYFEFDWDDELRAEGHLPLVPPPVSFGPEDARPQFLTGSESPMTLRFIRQMGMNDGVITDRSASPDYSPGVDDDVICEQREAAEMFASSLQQKLEEVPKDRSLENVANCDPSVDLNPPAHHESCIKSGSFVAIENNGRVVPSVYVDGSDFMMEVDILSARKIGWTSSKRKSLVDREKFICVLKNVESQAQPKSKSATPLKVFIFSESLF